ncbi:uncharacterized protein AKAME5_001938800 [Lates japonicus]|uniref:Uncharacterized protein n=1 Tax=Lates japonicus TaxID=270547 RepID=A0AAD3RHC1_LATJO|nr:uncharacterized protein AKAME5_001938800 [Lates japonicus]
MSVNSSSSSTISPPHPFPSNSSLITFLSSCSDSRVGNFIFIAFTITNTIILLPLSIFVLYLGHRQCCSASTSHCDFITYHMVVMEMVCLLGSICYCIGIYTDISRMMMVGSHVFFITSCGQMFYHTLTCAERYLAVVHPITFLHLTKGSGIKISNSMVWGFWLLGCAEMGLVALDTTLVIGIVYVVHLGVVSFCSFSVLKVLKHPRPGEVGGDRDQSKQRAFYTITAILGTLLLRFGGNLLCVTVYALPQMSHSDRCVALDTGYWFSLPSNLVLPLLFLHKKGELPFCKKNNKT